MNLILGNRGFATPDHLAYSSASYKQSPTPHTNNTHPRRDAMNEQETRLEEYYATDNEIAALEREDERRKLLIRLAVYHLHALTRDRPLSPIPPDKSHEVALGKLKQEHSAALKKHEARISVLRKENEKLRARLQEAQAFRSDVPKPWHNALDPDFGKLGLVSRGLSVGPSAPKKLRFQVVDTTGYSSADSDDKSDDILLESSRISSRPSSRSVSRRSSRLASRTLSRRGLDAGEADVSTLTVKSGRSGDDEFASANSTMTKPQKKRRIRLKTSLLVIKRRKVDDEELDDYADHNFDVLDPMLELPEPTLPVNKKKKNVFSV